MSYYGKQVGKQIGGMAPISAIKHANKTAIRANHFSGTAMKGSLEGLIKQKNAMIEFSGVGYSNPAAMTARYSRLSLKNNKPQYGTIDNNIRAMNVNSNYTFRAKNIKNGLV